MPLLNVIVYLVMAGIFFLNWPIWLVRAVKAGQEGKPTSATINAVVCIWCVVMFFALYTILAGHLFVGNPVFLPYLASC